MTGQKKSCDGPSTKSYSLSTERGWLSAVDCVVRIIQLIPILRVVLGDGFRTTARPREETGRRHLPATSCTCTVRTYYVSCVWFTRLDYVYVCVRVRRSRRVADPAPAPHPLHSVPRLHPQSRLTKEHLYSPNLGEPALFSLIMPLKYECLI